ncbi:protein KINESIN LIGHT CHAIN-RELATED 1 [Selaginella moellendorffii]|nr:protein KINESIN LIGHT CHAIN-RELATED 1 [Selaginella moellendorffii]|eukprot:XP_002989709.2 protein KINESIN LIGHT CHAIN-RELATED 1 [Selaginella moellendorffii]
MGMERQQSSEDAVGKKKKKDVKDPAGPKALHKTKLVKATGNNNADQVSHLEKKEENANPAENKRTDSSGAPKSQDPAAQGAETLLQDIETPVHQKKISRQQMEKLPTKQPPTKTKTPPPEQLQKVVSPVELESQIPSPTPKPPGSPGRALYLLKLAKSSHISGDKPSKTLDYASRAAKMLEANSSDGKPSLELVMSLHIVAAAQCRMGKHWEAVEALEKTLQSLPMEWIAEAGGEYSLAAFAGYMQLGDTYTKLGKQVQALESYRNALTVQKKAVGEMDPQVGETCRYLAEAYLQAMQFEDAEELCQQMLKIHAEKSPAGSMEEAVDRRLMALIQSGKGEHEAALEHLVYASTAMSSRGQSAAVASIDASIGDCYVALGRFDEAVFSYQKALAAFKQLNGANHASVASMYVSLGDLYLKTGKMRDAKVYCENALMIYGKQGHPADELAAGLTDVAAIYEALSEREQAMCLLRKALESIKNIPGEPRSAAGIEAQMGVLYYIMGNFSESHSAFSSAVDKLRSAGETNTLMLGVLLNQMGLALFELEQIHEAVAVLEEAQHVLAEACGVYHPDTIAVCSNLAGGYDALGRVEDAIDLLQVVLRSQEERLGTVHPDVVDERLRLEQMLRETGKPLVRKTSTLEELLMRPTAQSKRYYRSLAV